jgi:hypothetical protein
MNVLAHVRHKLAASITAAAFAATTLLSAQPVAADTVYPVNVTFDSVKFTMVNDGCSWDIYCHTDSVLEVYGTVGAYTGAGAVSAGGLPYRNFGKWGQSPCTSQWTDSFGATCTKKMTLGTFSFSNVFLCGGSAYTACSTGYAKGNNTVALQVHAGEQIRVTVSMQDYDWGSANDNVCVTATYLGPYTAAQLQGKTYVNDAQSHPLNMGYNGNAECWVAYHLS